MARMSSQLLLTLDEGKEEDHQEQGDEEMEEEEEEEESDEIAERFKCISLHKRDHTKRGGKVVYGGQWRQEQRLRASRMEQHLSERWAIDELIEEQLSRFDAHYSRILAMGAPKCTPKDVAQLLMPKCRLSMEMASLTWLGNWRPSAILSLLHWVSRSRSRSRVLTQLIRETRIEEAVLDEEMTEIQATCILHLIPFSPVNANLPCLHSEFNKIYRVITQAQKLRYKTLELVVKKLLNRTQAAEFLVAFTGIQDMVHEFATFRRRQKGPISVTIKPFGGT